MAELVVSAAEDDGAFVDFFCGDGGGALAIDVPGAEGALTINWIPDESALEEPNGSEPASVKANCWSKASSSAKRKRNSVWSRTLALPMNRCTRMPRPMSAPPKAYTS